MSSSAQQDCPTGGQYQLGDGIWKESKNMGTETETLRHQDQETNTSFEYSEMETEAAVISQELIPPNESKNAESTHLVYEDEADSDESMGNMIPPQYAMEGASSGGTTFYPIGNEQNTNAQTMPPTIFYQPWLPSPCPQQYNGPFNLDKLVEFRQNLIFGSSFLPVWPGNPSYDPRDKFITNLPLRLIVVESVVHYATQAYTMSMRGNWVTGVAHIPMAQHICICLDNEYRRYEVVLRVRIIRSVEEKFAYSSNSMTTTMFSSDIEIVSCRILKSKTSLKPNFRSLLRQSLLANVAPLLSNVPFELVLGRATGRCHSMDQVINAFMMETNSTLETHFYPLMQHLVQNVELKLPGASFLFKGHFFRPYLSAASILITNGSTQLLETMDIRIFFDQRRMFGLAYDSTLGRVYGGEQMDRTKIGISVISACNYMEPGIRRSEPQTDANQNPSIPPTCNPFIVFEVNPIFNPGFYPYLTTTFVVPTVVSCQVPSQQQVNSLLNHNASLDTTIDGPMDPACFGFTDSCDRYYGYSPLIPHVYPQFTLPPHISGMRYPPVFFNLPNQKESQTVEQAQSSSREAEATESQTPPTKFNPNAQDFHPKGTIQQQSQHASSDMNNNFPVFERSTASNAEFDPHLRRQQLNEGFQALSFPTQIRQQHLPRPQPQHFTMSYLNSYNNQVPVLEPLPLLNGGPFSLSLETDFLESEDELMFENETDVNLLGGIGTTSITSVNRHPFNDLLAEETFVDRNSNMMRRGRENAPPLVHDHSRCPKKENESNESWSEQMEHHVDHNSGLLPFGNQDKPMNNTPAPYEYDNNRSRHPNESGRGRGDETSPSGDCFSGRGGRHWVNSNYDNNYRRYHYDSRDRDQEYAYPARGRGRGRGRSRGRGRGGFSRFEGEYNKADRYASEREQPNPTTQNYNSRPPLFGKRNEEGYPTDNSENVVPERPKNSYAAILANGLESENTSTSEHHQEITPVVEATSEESIENVNAFINGTTYVNSQNSVYQNFNRNLDGESSRVRYAPAWNEQYKNNTSRDQRNHDTIELQVERDAGGEPSQL